jgi:hypothetical protein
MENLFFKAALFLVLGLVFTNCGHSQVQEGLNAKIQAFSRDLPDTQSPGLQKELDAAIAQNPDISADQKSRLDAVRARLRTEISAHRKADLILRKILIQDLFQAQPNSAEIESIKDRLRSNETEKLSALFRAVEQANGILGRPTPHHTQVMESFFDMHGEEP